MAGLVQVLNNVQLDQAAAKQRALAIPEQRERGVSKLAAYVKTCFDEAKRAKDQTITGRLLDCGRRRKGEYDPIKRMEIRQMGGSEVFIMLTDIKCRAAESWVKDILMPADDRPWMLEPTPLPDINPQLAQMVTMVVQMEMQMLASQGAAIHPLAFQQRANELFDMHQAQLKQIATRAAERMSLKIEDQLVEGGFRKSFEGFLTDFCTFPTAFIKGPVRRSRRVLKWGPQFQPIVAKALVWEFPHCSVHDLFFDPCLNDLNRGYLVERHQLTKLDLLACKGVPGYDNAAIDLVIAEFGRSGLREWLHGDMERALLEDRSLSYITPTTTIEALEMSGPVDGAYLIECGFTAPGVTAEEVYEANIWQIGPFVIKATLNEDPLLRRGYYGASFEDVPGSIYGRAPPEMMADVQDLCNGAGRSLANNMAIASGPQVVVKVDRLPAGEAVTKIWPWKIHQMTSAKAGHAGSDPPIEFFQPASNAQELLAVFEFFSKKADEVTGIPNYTYGSTNVTGAGRTASGLSMLMGAASKGIKQAIFNIDIGVIEPVIERMYFNNMLTEEDQSIKGDLKVKARGATALIAKEIQAERRNELLLATNNPVDLQIIGLPGALRAPARRGQGDRRGGGPCGADARAARGAVAAAGHAAAGPAGSGQRATGGGGGGLRGGEGGGRQEAREALGDEEDHLGAAGEGKARKGR